MNDSKKKDRRFWDRWYESGAVVIVARLENGEYGEYRCNKIFEWPISFYEKYLSKIWKVPANQK